MLIFYLHV